MVYLDDRSSVISMKYDAIIVTVNQVETGNFDVALSSVSRLDYGYLGGAIKGAGWIWTVHPFRNTMLLVLRPHGINLSPTLAGASVGGTWQVSGVRWRCAVASGKCQVSGGGVQCKRTRK